MPVAEIIAIGTELLLGEIQDTNTRFLGRVLRDAGIDIYRATIIGDNVERIAHLIRESMQRCQIILTTGGLGPTVDDPTRQAVALALGVEMEFRSELWEQIEERFRRYGRQATENNRRQAYIPCGATAIENPVGTAPAFSFETASHVIISLPGVPREMEYLIHHSVMPFLQTKYHLHDVIRARVLHTSGVGESQIDEWIGDLETSPNPTVGLAAHPGQVDVRITAKAGSVEEAEQMIETMAKIASQRLGEAVYGADDQTLEEVVGQKLAAKAWRLHVVEDGFSGELLTRLQAVTGVIGQVRAGASPCVQEELHRQLIELQKQSQSEAILSACLQPDSDKQLLSLLLITPEAVVETSRSYGGHPNNATPWAANMALDFLRRNL